MSKLSDYFGRVTADDFYTPAMMEWDGVTGTSWTSPSYSSIRNEVTVVCRFKISPFTGDTLEYLFTAQNSSTYDRITAAFISSNYSSLPNRRGCLQFWGKNSAGTLIFTLLSNTGYDDGADHTLFCSFNSSTGAYTIKIDGVDAEDTGNADKIAFGTYTMPKGAGSSLLIGNDLSGGNVKQIGYFGMRDNYQTNWSDFMTSDGQPKELDESGWTEWGAQPLFWNEHGEMNNNLGSAGDMTKNGTIVIGKGGN